MTSVKIVEQLRIDKKHQANTKAHANPVRIGSRAV